VVRSSALGSCRAVLIVSALIACGSSSSERSTRRPPVKRSPHRFPGPAAGHAGRGMTYRVQRRASSWRATLASATSRSSGREGDRGAGPRNLGWPSRTGRRGRRHVQPGSCRTGRSLRSGRLVRDHSATNVEHTARRPGRARRRPAPMTFALNEAAHARAAEGRRQGPVGLQRVPDGPAQLGRPTWHVGHRREPAGGCGTAEMKTWDQGC
jgi:hypothetical protein